MKKHRPFWGTVFLVLGLFWSEAALATDQVDLKVAFRVLPLLTNKIVSPATVGIVYAPDNPASAAEAKTVQSLIDGGLEAPGGVTLSSVLVPANDLKKLSDVKVAFLAKGLSASALDAVSQAAAAARILTMSTAIGYVRANKCVLGITSQPSVQIYYSKTAADSGKIGFAHAFEMLVSQL